MIALGEAEVSEKSHAIVSFRNTIYTHYNIFITENDCLNNINILYKWLVVDIRSTYRLKTYGICIVILGGLVRLSL